MSADLKVFRLRKSKWLRGGMEPSGSPASSRLWKSSFGAGCCLGLLAIQCGVDQRELDGVSFPSMIRVIEAPDEYRRVVEIDSSDDYSLTRQIAGVNDRFLDGIDGKSDDVRIDALTSMFAELGWKLEVVE